MKRAITVLAVLLMAATTYTQTSRRTASTTSSAKSEHRATQTSRSNSTSTRSSATRVNSNQSTTKSTSPDRNSSTYHDSRNADRSSNNSVDRTSTATRTPDRSRTTHTTTTTTRTPGHSANRTTTTTTNVHRSGDRDGRTTTTTHNTPAHSVNRTTTEHSYRTYPAERYTTTRVYRGQQHSKHVYSNSPYTKDYRAVHYVYREPVHVHVIWTREMHHNYIDMYPHVRHWEYRYGYSINTISAYYADYYIGDVKTVYGRVKEVFYSPETDEFFLNIGDYYPYQDFTIVLPGYIAREYTRRPISYFTNQYVDVTGLITEFDGKPEIVVKRRFQLDVY